MPRAAVLEEPTGPVDIELFPQQDEFVNDPSYAVAAVTGRGGGKTFAGSVKLLKYVTDHPGAVAMVAAPTYTMLHDSPMTTVFSTWPQMLLSDWGLGLPAAKGPVELQLPNGSLVLFRSADEPDRMRGPNLSYLWFDEAAYCSYEAFDVARGCLRDSRFPNQMAFTTTPKGFNWFYDTFVRHRPENYALHHWTTMENDYNPPEYVPNMSEGKSPETILQEVRGQFVLVSGAVQFEQEWMTRQLEAARDVRPEYHEDGIALTLYAPYDPTHQYVLGVDPKGQGADLGFGALLDWSFGVIVGKLRSTNKDSTVLLDHAIGLAKRYSPRGNPEAGCLCAPENNGVGQAYAPQMRKAGLNVFKRKQLRGENPEHYREVNWGWDMGSRSRDILLSTFQKLIRRHRLSSPDRELWETAGSWDAREDPHLPDYISASGIACAAGEALWGEMGSSVAEAERASAEPTPLFRPGRPALGYMRRVG